MQMPCGISVLMISSIHNMHYGAIRMMPLFNNEKSLYNFISDVVVASHNAISDVLFVLVMKRYVCACADEMQYMM